MKEIGTSSFYSVLIGHVLCPGYIFLRFLRLFAGGTGLALDFVAIVGGAGVVAGVRGEG